MTPPADWLLMAGTLMMLVPPSYSVAAALPGAGDQAGALRAWRWGCGVAAAAFAASLLAVAMLLLGAGGPVSLVRIVPLGPFGSLDLSVRLDGLTAIMLVLVTFVGWMILQFSRRYLAGEAGQVRYVRWFLATLASVTLFVVSNNLLLMGLAWIATSLCLHQLLVFYPERPQAILAAHKKFLVSRAADVCLLVAIALTSFTFGTLELDGILARVDTLSAIPATLQAATVLFAASAILKCAQLPFHGWLIQVMEAPTPVSALLHAGIVNMGGFLMIRLAPLMGATEYGQAMLVVAGTVTAVVAALVMTTRISVKVALAWSTCAQMGFMLVECGLGAHSLALVHLVAHSLYKAHAFLRSGSTVDQWRAQALLQGMPRPGVLAWIGGTGGAVLAVAAAAWITGGTVLETPSNVALALVVAWSLAVLLARAIPGGPPQIGRAAVTVIAVITLYFAWHAGLSGLLGHTAVPPPAAGLVAFVVVAFAGLAVLQGLLVSRPASRIARALHPVLFAGLYLDELFTRATFRIWPPGTRRDTRSGDVHPS